MEGYHLNKTGERVSELLSRQFVVPTLDSVPTEQTRNWIDGEYLVDFRIGELCRVKVEEEWVFYRLVDIVGGKRVWAKANASEMPDMSDYYTKEETDKRIEEHTPDLSDYATKKELEEALEGVGSKDDLMAIELSEEGDMVLTYGEETNLSDGYILEDGELVLEFNYE